MKNKSLQTFAAISLALAGFQLSSEGGYVDITAYDGTASKTYKVSGGPAAGKTSSDPRPGIGESGEVEPASVANASWDLRAMAFDVNTNSLMIVSGFNPLALNDGISIGDVFIDINNSFTIPQQGSRPHLTYLPLSNSVVGFEYAIDLISPGNGGLGYNIVALSQGSTMLTGAYHENDLSDPATLVASGADTILSSGTFSVTTKTDAQVLADLGLNIGTNGGTNYVFTFDLSAASLAGGATFRLTETCGNDLLVGQLAANSVVAVPETSTWVMGFLAIGAVLVLWRKQNKVAASTAKALAPV